MPRGCVHPELRYADVAPIFEAHCLTCHHGELDGQWSLHNYAHVADWQDTIPEELRGCTMPPPEAKTVISDEERLKIIGWFNCGFPR